MYIYIYIYHIFPHGSAVGWCDGALLRWFAGALSALLNGFSFNVAAKSGKTQAHTKKWNTHWKLCLEGGFGVPFWFHFGSHLDLKWLLLRSLWEPRGCHGVALGLLLSSREKNRQRAITAPTFWDILAALASILGPVQIQQGTEIASWASKKH